MAAGIKTHGSQAFLNARLLILFSLAVTHYYSFDTYKPIIAILIYCY